jgi:SAM-dependent methyltransferase
VVVSRSSNVFAVKERPENAPLGDAAESQRLVTLKSTGVRMKINEVPRKCRKMFAKALRWMGNKVHQEPPPRNIRTQLAEWFLKGSGLEIGALHNPLWTPPGARVTYVDRMTVEELRRQYLELDSYPLVPVDLIDDGETLKTIPAASQDFIIANHFLEHTQNPVGTIQRHLEVLRPGGILYMAVPDKRWTFDSKRPVTPLEHLYRDYEEGPSWSYLDHVREWCELVDNQTGPALEEDIKHIIETNYSIHFHVWTQKELLEMLTDIRCRLRMPFDIQALMVNRERSEVITILQKV